MKNFIIEIIYSFLPILFPPKKTDTKSWEIGICTLLCHKHLNFLIYNLMSFVTLTGKTLPLYVVDDGSLTSTDYKKLQKYFTVTIESVNSSRRKIKTILKKYKNIYKFRFNENTAPLKQKLDPIFLNPFKKFIYLDADILFFNKPKRIIKWLNAKSNLNFYSAHLPYPDNFFGKYSEALEHSYRLLLFKYFAINIDPTFSSGLLLFNKSSLDLKKQDKIFKYFFQTFYAYNTLAEETSFAFIVDQSNYKKLPLDKYINAWNSEEYYHIFSSAITSLHYSGPLKYENLRLKKDSIKLAFKLRFFRNRIE